MKSRRLMLVTAITLFAALALPVQLAAQHTRYKLIDLGTPGGPNSYPTIAGPGIRFLNDAGAVAGWGDTTAPDPTCFGNDGLCLLTHTFRWKNGVRTDLGALPGTNSSAAVAINAAGSILGVSENGLTDPISGFPEIRAVLWKHDLLTELGALGNLVLPQNLNNVGQAVGGFENTTPDPFSLFGFPTQTRAFLSQKGVMQDIGTLGGPDAFAFSINERGQVAGMSYTNAVPNKTTNMPTLEPFLWDHGTMTPLGTLGGTVGSPGAEGSIMINNRGQIIGTSNLFGDGSTHAFVWENGVMTDLFTLGGPNSYPLWINDTGEIVGEADISDVKNALGKKILFVDFSNCKAGEVETISRKVPDYVTTQPLGSVLILTDFAGASFDRDALLTMKETAVFDKPFVKKSALMGTDSLPREFYEDMKSFSRRELPIFKNREEALEWLVS